MLLSRFDRVDRGSAIEFVARFEGTKHFLELVGISATCDPYKFNVPVGAIPALREAIDAFEAESAADDDNR